MTVPSKHVQGGEQRGRAVAYVVVGHRPGLAGFKRQAGLGPVQRLDLSFLVDGQHHGTLRRVDVQADDIAQLAGQIGVSGQLKGPDALRLELVVGPDALDRLERDPDIAGHPPSRPTCRCARRFRRGQLDDTLNHVRGQGVSLAAGSCP